jgi:hypothetical protein
LSDKPARNKKKHNWPPPAEPYVPRQRNPIHSVLTALPVIMLMAGLYYYYHAESKQLHSPPIRAESVSVSGIFTGMSVVQSGAQGRHYLWFEESGSARGVRVRPDQAQSMSALSKGERVSLKIAPTVHASSTYWAWYVEQGGVVYLNEETSLQ